MRALFRAGRAALGSLADRLRHRPTQQPATPIPAVEASPAPPRFRLSIGAFLTLCLGGLVGLPLIVVFAVNFGAAVQNTRALLTAQAEEVMRDLLARTEGYLAPAEAVPLFLGDLVDRGTIGVDAIDQVREAIRYAFAGAPQLKSVAYVHSQGWSLVAVRGQDGEPIEVQEGRWRDDPVMRGAVERAALGPMNPRWSEPIFIPEIGMTLVAFVRPIWQDGHFRAAIAATITIQELSRFVARLGNSIGDSSFILYGRNHVLAHRNLAIGQLPISRSQPLPRLNDVGDPVLAQIWAGNEESRELALFRGLKGATLEQQRLGDRDYLFLHAALPLRGAPEPWIVGGYVPADQANQPVERRILIAGIVGAAALLVAAIGAFMLGRGLRAPLGRLAAASEAVSRLEIEHLAALPRSRLVEIDHAVAAFDRMVVALRLFARYVPRRLVQVLLERGEAEILVSTEREVTILFTDIVGFTPMAEQWSAEACAQFLNAHLGMLTACVEAEGGLVDKFIGDCVMAFWTGIPEQPDQAERAVRAALRMREALHADNAAHGREVRIRIGIHTGRVIVGNIGATTRLNFTIVGDAVNIAQRLEQLNKVLQPDQTASILMSAATAAQLPPGYRLRSLGRHRQRGRQQEMELFTIDDPAR